MTSRLNKGAGNLDAILILAFVIFVMFATGGGGGKGTSTGLFSGPTLNLVGDSSTSSSEPVRYTSKSTTTTTGSTKITISSGNAAYEYQPYKEYISVENWGNSSLDITGWTLKNGKDKRTYNVGGNLQRYSADIAQIPQGTALLSPTGNNVMRDIVLEKGERAIITTGSIAVSSPYKIVSFKENSCTGYLERSSDYSFEPALQISCPQPKNEPGLDELDAECQTVVKSISSCTTPQFSVKDRDNVPCDNCLNGHRLSNACAAFIKEHFSYRGCLAFHASDPGFASSRTWRIFLGRSWEMWAKNYESIELFDRFNTLMASQNY